jgi:hypothetical protein
MDPRNYYINYKKINIYTFRFYDDDDLTVDLLLTFLPSASGSIDCVAQAKQLASLSPPVLSSRSNWIDHRHDVEYLDGTRSLEFFSIIS